MIVPLHHPIKEYSPIKGVSKKDFAIMSKLIVDNTIKTIELYKPKYWYIENPRLSLMWKYINNNKDYHNLAIYGAYNHPVKKPTIFLSNLKMDLKTDTENKKFLKWDKDFTNQEKRSEIPKKLIIDIFNKFNKEADDGE